MSSGKNDKRAILIHTFFVAIRHNCIPSIVLFSVLMMLIPIYAFLGDTKLDKDMEDNLFPCFQLISGQAVYPFYLVIIGSILLCVWSFNFLLSQKKSCVYFGLQISRNILFLSRYFTGLVLLEIAVSVPLLLSMLGNLYYYTNTPDYAILKSALKLLIGFSLTTFISYSLTVLVVSICGRVAESIFNAICLLYFPVALSNTFYSLIANCLFGRFQGDVVDWQSNTWLEPMKYIYDIIWTYSSTSAVSCPGGVDMKSYMQSLYLYDISDQLLITIPYLLVSALITVAAFAIFKRRPAELAERSTNNLFLDFTSTFSVALTSFTITLFSIVNTTYSHTEPFENSPQLKWSLAFLAFAITFMLTFFISKRGNMKFKSAVAMLAAQMLILFAAIGIMYTGGLGFSGKIPEIRDIKSVKLLYSVPDPSVRSNEWDQIGHYNELTFVSENDIRSAAEVHRSIIAHGRQDYYKGKKTTGFADKIVPLHIYFSYELNDGTIIKRAYDRTTMQNIVKLFELDGSEAAKDKFSKELYSLDYLTSGYVYMCGNADFNRSPIDIDSKKRSGLLNALGDDMLKLGAEERYLPAKQAIGIIGFALFDPQVNFTYFDRSTELNKYYRTVFITEQFESTIKFLKKNDLYKNFSNNNEIEEITLNKYALYNNEIWGTNWYFTTRFAPSSFLHGDYEGLEVARITDKDRINDIAKNLQSNYHVRDGGYIAKIKLKGSGIYVFKFLPLDKAPSDIELH